MALSSVLQSESADFSFDKAGSFGYGCGHNDLDESLNFAVRASMNPVDADGPERKIEFLHGTTTLAFKVSCTASYLLSLLSVGPCVKSVQHIESG